MPIDNTTHFVSLTDGTPHNSQSSSDHPEFIAAADGWIRIRSWKDNATLTPDGTPTGSFSTPTARSSAKAALLEGGSGTPKISELRRAYESEDISWANTSLVCTQDGGCRFNGAGSRSHREETLSLPPREPLWWDILPITNNSRIKSSRCRMTPVMRLR